MEERQVLVMSSTYPGSVQWTYRTPVEELIARVEQLEQKLNNVAKNKKSTEELLKEWISLTYIRKHKECATSKGQHGLWESVLAPYIAAYLAGFADRLTYKEFNEVFDMDIKSSSYSNWTKCYFYGAKHKRHLFTKEELVKWWKKLQVPPDEYERILDDLVRKDLLKTE